MIELTEVYIRYNPYRLTTVMTINGNPLSEDSSLAQAISGKRLQSWIGALPEMLKNERGSREFQIRFHGNALDYDDVKDSFEQARKKGVISNYQTMCEEAVGDSEVYDSILRTYNDLMGDPYFTENLSKSDREGLEGAIKRVQNNVFPIHVIATMSSGKSTLINALLQKKLMPARNEATTAIITEILDDDEKAFSAIVYDINDNEIKTIKQLTYEIMDELNSNTDVSRVSIEGNIPFLEATETRLRLVDTPGPNNARNQNHRETTYRNINSATENMILYVLNYTQLGINDDATLLSYVADEIKKGGKETRDRFIFVLNKIDELKKEDGSVAHAIENTKLYLAKRGIDDPQIFPCSAFAALGLRTFLADIDPYDSEAVEEAVEEYDDDDIRDASKIVIKLNRKEDLHLEQYSTLTPSEQEKIRIRLLNAEERKDRKTEALIHSGICSIESAIRAYVQKYAKAKKIKDFVEPLEQQLIQVEKEAVAKLAALSGGEEALEIQRRSQAICDMIQQGEEARKFKKQIEKIDPVPEIKETAEGLVSSANEQLVKRFKHLGEEIEGRDNALKFLNAFSDDAAEVLSNLSAQLEILVEKELTATGKDLVLAYHAKLEGFDNSVGSKLDFSTSDLVAGVLSRLKNAALDYSPSGEMRSQQEEGIDEIHEDVVETVYEDKIVMKEITETVQDGVEKVQTGTERVVVGTHQEQEGYEDVEVERGGWIFGKIADKLFGKKTKKVPKMVTYEDVEYRPTYEYVPRMVEVVREIPTIEQVARENIHYVVSVAELQRKLVMPISQQLDKEVAELIEVATFCINDLKNQFISSFDEVDAVITQKYKELESFTQQQGELDQRKTECEKMLKFIRGNMQALKDAVDI